MVHFRVESSRPQEESAQSSAPNPFHRPVLWPHVSFVVSRSPEPLCARMSLGSVPQAMSQAVAAQKAREKEKASAQGASSPAANGASSSSPLTSAVGSQLRLIIANLNKKNYKTSSEEVKHIIGQYGQEAYSYLLRFLLEGMDLKADANEQRSQKDQCRLQLLSQECSSLLVEKPFFISVLVRALEGLLESTSPSPLPDELVSKLSRLLKLSATQELTLGLALLSSVEPKLQQEGGRYLKGKLPDLNQQLLPEGLLQHLLYHYKSREPHPKNEAVVLKALQKYYPNAEAYVSALPLTENAPLTFTLRSAESSSQQKLANTAGGSVGELVSRVSTSTRPADVLEEIGYPAMQTAAVFKELLTHFPALKEADVASMLAVMVRTHFGLEDGASLSLYITSAPPAPASASEERGWNTTVFVDVLRELYPRLNWLTVFKNLDQPMFVVPDARAFSLLLTVLRRGHREPLPAALLLEDWNNTKGQLSLLRYALDAPAEQFDWTVSLQLSGGALVSLPPAAAADGSASTGPIGVRDSQWQSPSVIGTLLRLAEVENYGIVRGLFEKPIKQCPDALILALAKLQPKRDKPLWTPLYHELCTILLNVFLSNHTNASFVLTQLWNLNRNMVIRGMVELYIKDPSCLSRLLDIALELRALSMVLDARPFVFAIDLAALASHREFLYLEKWMNDKITEHENAFMRACIAYLKEKTVMKADGSMAISLETLNIFFKCLLGKQSLLSADLQEELKQLYASHRLPQVQNNEPGTDPNSAAGAAAAGGEPKFPQYIIDAANTIFRRIYRGELSVPQAIVLLKQLKESKMRDEEMTFLCTIYNLFEEYRFFPKFPEKELQITALLFGSLIQHQLVSYIPLGMALRYVLEALRKPAGSNMCTFGITALEQFKSRLNEWPQYCSHIMQIPHLRQTRPDIIDYVEKISLLSTPGATTAGGANAAAASAASSQQASSAMGVPSSVVSGIATAGMSLAPPPASSTPAQSIIPAHQSAPAALSTTPPAASNGPSGASSPVIGGMTSRDMLMPNSDKLQSFSSIMKPLHEPPEAIQDKMYFIINNLAPNNMDQKAAEMRELLRLEYVAWLASYLVLKRVSLEPNFHQLYLSFLDKLNIADLNVGVLKMTLQAIHTILDGEKIKESSSERSVLKNLGTWLGSITLARNKPLLHKHMNLKGILCDAVRTQKLVGVIPFVCKIFETCKSKIFNINNVWVHAHLRLLMELYNLSSLKVNLKIEIEILFNHLGIDMKDVKPSSMLQKDTLGPSLGRSAGTLPLNIAQPSLGSLAGTGYPQLSTTPPGADSPLSAPIPLAALEGLSPEIVSLAIDRAIKEIISPVVERSGSIACVTTRELILKDFAAEADESRVRKAAHFMVQNLAGSLAMVTCKEPLRISITNHLRSLLPPLSPTVSEVTLENAIQQICSDNLELACSLIEKAAREKAVRDIDEVPQLVYAYNSRKKHRDAQAAAAAQPRPPQPVPFYDVAFASQRFAAGLPDLLRPRTADPNQLRVYEDFSRLARLSVAAAGTPGKSDSPPPTGPAAAAAAVAGAPTATTPPLAAAVPPSFSQSPALLSPVPSSALSVSGAAQQLVSASSPPLTSALEKATAAKAAAMGKPARLMDSVKLYFEEWLALNQDPVTNEKSILAFSSNLLALLKGEEVQNNWFRLLTDICVEYHDRHNAAGAGSTAVSYPIIDLYAKLVVFLAKSTQDPNARITLLNAACNGVVEVLLSDFELKKGKFDQRPYHRLFLNWMQELLTEAPSHSGNVQIFATAFLKLRPAVVPGFAFAWVELIFHSLFMPKLLLSKSQKGWPFFKRLLVELLRFLEPYLRNAELTEPIRLLYKGTLKALLVLLHDFPEFLCDHHYSFCDVIPPSCIQLRNIILSAFPRHMHLPDPFTPNLKVDRLPEINQPPHILSDFQTALMKNNLKTDVDNFFKNRPQTFLRELRPKLLLPAGESFAAGTKYNVPVINALVMYVGVQAIATVKSTSTGGKGAAPSFVRSPAMEIYSYLAADLDTEGRYLFLNAIANQLRYPNNHTHYFSCVLLYLFAEARQEIVKEQITRVLLERLIVNRPHPWGLLITFLEIIKNPRYEFWKNAFTSCDPEIKRLFDSVSKTCMGKGKGEGASGGAAFSHTGGGAGDSDSAHDMP